MITHFLLVLNVSTYISTSQLKDARRMRKEWGTGEKEFGNLLDKERK